MSTLLLALFLVSVLLIVFFAWKSRHTVVFRLAVIGATLAFAAMTYLLATNSALSPFSRPSGIGFGVEDRATIVSVIVALVVAIGGVFGSYFFNIGKGKISLRGLLRPISASPLVIVPTIKLIESAGDPNLLAYILLFALAYQNGFFWERLLKE
jgi:hypothetical protein